MPSVTVAPRGVVIPDGTDVAAYPKHETEVERREGRVPIPAPSDTGTLSGGKVTLDLEPGHYVLVGFVDEVQQIKVEATGGTLVAKFGEAESGAISFNATAEVFQEKLEEIEALAGNVEVTGGPGDEGGDSPYVVKFINELAGSDVAALTVDGTELTGGEEQATVSTTTQGSKAGEDAIQRTCLFYVEAE